MRTSVKWSIFSNLRMTSKWALKRKFRETYYCFLYRHTEEGLGRQVHTNTTLNSHLFLVEQSGCGWWLMSDAFRPCQLYWSLTEQRNSCPALRLIQHDPDYLEMHVWCLCVLLVPWIKLHVFISRSEKSHHSLHSQIIMMYVFIFIL